MCCGCIHTASGCDAARLVDAFESFHISRSRQLTPESTLESSGRWHSDGHCGTFFGKRGLLESRRVKTRVRPPTLGIHVRILRIGAIAMRTRAAAAILAGTAIVAVAMWRRRRRRIVGVTVFARHGARAPNNGEMKVFSKDSAARLQWHHDDGRPPDYEASNNLTDVGRDQMRAVGRWLAQTPK